MDVSNDPVKIVDPERVTSGTESTSYHSGDEGVEAKTEKALPAASPDCNREEVEQMDRAHLEDLERQRTATSINVGSRRSLETLGLQRTTSRASTKGRLSRIATNLSTIIKNPKGRIKPLLLPTSDLDNGIVGWESQNDPEMPLNFPESRKWLLISLISSITLISPLASSMFAPAVPFMDKDFHNSSTILSALVVSIFVLGFATGPLVLAPSSEIYGRRYVLTCANAFFCVWQIGCALAPNLPSLIIMRFLAGIGGSGCLTIGGGMIADLFHPDRRGSATAIYSLGPLFGPVIGPICGGFMAQLVSWRWIFWLLLIVASTITIGIELLTRETNPKVLIQRKVLRLQKELNRPELRSCYESATTPHEPSIVLINALGRPFKMLFLSPIVFILALYMSVIYGLLYLFLTTLPTVMAETYHWKQDITGLAYIGLGVGFFLGVAVVAKLSDATVIRMTKANNGVFEPEMRLPTCIVFAFFIPISFFWYGWSADKVAPWIVPCIGLIPFGFGMIGVYLPTQTYVIDAFPEFAASGVAALTVSRSVFGAFLPLAGSSMFESLGLGWGNSVLGFIAVALIPAPLLIYKFGESIRKNHPINL